MDYGFVWQELLQGYEEYGKEDGFIIFQNKNALNMGTIFSYYMKPSEYEKLSDKELKLSYAGAEEGMVFLSVPYSDGFSAYVDGQRAEVIKVDGGLMAVAVSQGSKSVELVYREPGLIEGVILSGIGLLLFLVYMFVQKRRNV